VFRDTPAPLLGEEGICLSEYEGTDLSKYVVIVDEIPNLGRAWYCEDQTSRAIYRISDLENLVEFVNSGRSEFTASLEAAARWSAANDNNAIMKCPNVIEDLVKALMAIDRKAFQSPQFYWPMTIDHIKFCALDSEEGMPFWFKVE
jgi:hypothetical protein